MARIEYNRLKNNLDTILNKRNISSSKFSSFTGISRTTIEELRNNPYKNCSERTSFKIYSALGIKHDDLFEVVINPIALVMDDPNGFTEKNLNLLLKDLGEFNLNFNKRVWSNNDSLNISSKNFGCRSIGIESCFRIYNWRLIILVFI